jgi:hypothetical protein
MPKTHAPRWYPCLLRRPKSPLTYHRPHLIDVNFIFYIEQLLNLPVSFRFQYGYRQPIGADPGRYVLELLYFQLGVHFWYPPLFRGRLGDS